MSIRPQIQVGPETDDAGDLIGLATLLWSVVFRHQSHANVQILGRHRFCAANGIRDVTEPPRLLLGKRPQQHEQFIRFSGAQRFEKDLRQIHLSASSPIDRAPANVIARVFGSPEALPTRPPERTSTRNKSPSPRSSL